MYARCSIYKTIIPIGHEEKGQGEESGGGETRRRIEEEEEERGGGEKQHGLNEWVTEKGPRLFMVKQTNKAINE